jgi:lipoate-protein ligase A
MHQNSSWEVAAPWTSERTADAAARDAGRHIAEDHALLHAVETGTSEHLVRYWHVLRPAVVIGRHGVVIDDVNLDACHADGVPVVRRFSGGGAVVLGPGCLNYAVALSLVSHPALADVAASFRIVLETVVAALAVPGLTVAGGTDLAIGGRKVSGNAQRRGRRAILHHGTLLFDFDPGLGTKYLKEPARRPAYRGERRHRDFLGNLPLSAKAIRARLGSAWAPRLE